MVFDCDVCCTFRVTLFRPYVEKAMLAVIQRKVLQPRKMLQCRNCNCSYVVTVAVNIYRIH